MNGIQTNFEMYLFFLALIIFHTSNLNIEQFLFRYLHFHATKFPNISCNQLRLMGSLRSEDILPRQAENPINRKYFVLAFMCESYSGPAKSDPIKRSRLCLVFSSIQ